MAPFRDAESPPRLCPQAASPPPTIILSAVGLPSGTNNHPPPHIAWESRPSSFVILSVAKNHPSHLPVRQSLPPKQSINTRNPKLAQMAYPFPVSFPASYVIKIHVRHKYLARDKLSASPRPNIAGKGPTSSTVLGTSRPGALSTVTVLSHDHREPPAIILVHSNHVSLLVTGHSLKGRSLAPQVRRRCSCPFGTSASPKHPQDQQANPSTLTIFSLSTT